MKFTKLIAVIMLGLFLSSSVQAQKVDWGTTQKAKSKFYLPNIIGEDETGIYVKTPSRKGALIEKFDKKRKNRVFSVDVEKPNINNAKTEIERVVFVNDKFIGFSSVYLKKQKITKLYAYTIDKKSGKISSKKTEVFSMNVEKKSLRGDYLIFQSKDNTKLLVDHVGKKIEKVAKKNKKGKTKNGKRKKTTLIDRMKLYNSDLELLTERTDEYDLDEGIEYKTSNWNIDNDGSVYHLRGYEKGNNFIVSYDANNEFEKWEEKITIPETETKSEINIITDVHLHLNAENDMVLVGYLAGVQTFETRKGKTKINKRSALSGGHLKGMFITKIDNFSKETEVSEVSLFDQDFKNELRNKRQTKKDKDVEINNVFHNVKIVDKADGGIVFTGEQYTHYIHSSDKNYSETFTYGSVVALNIANDGKLEWAHAIQKKQFYSYSTSNNLPFVYFTSRGVRLFNRQYETKDFFSYAPILADGNLSIVYNDHPKNVSRKQGMDNLKKLRNPNKTMTMSNTINLETGKMVKKPYYSAKDFKVNLVPKVYFQSGQYTDIVLFGKKRKNFKFGIVEIEAPKKKEEKSNI